MNERDAEEFTQSLGQIVGGSWRQIALAKKLGVPKALGLSTEQWVRERLGGYIRLSVEDRREAVKELASSGESNVAIASVLGVNEISVRRDLDSTNVEAGSNGIKQLTAGDSTNVAPIDTVAALAATQKVRKAVDIAAARAESEDARERRRSENRALIAAAPNLATSAKFATIVVDPPWDWGDEGDADQLGRARPTYATMSIDELMALPVAELADTDCHLYLWITNRSLPKGFALLDEWGFRYITALTWCKPSFGIGNYFRGSTEQVLFGVKGSQMLKRKDAGTWFAMPRGPRGHSSKPAEFYPLVESCSPGPYMEIFARSERSGWCSWGAEANAA